MYIFQPDRVLLKKQIKNVAKYVTGKVLDVGAGGYDRYQTFFNCEKYVKMDVNHQDNIDVAGSAEAIPLADNEFDTIICTQVLEHLKHPAKAASEMHRILKTNGHLILTAPQINELHEEPYDFFRYTKYGIIALFEEAGFKIMEYEQRGGFFTTIAQLRIRYFIDKFTLYNKPLVGRAAGKLLHLYAAILMWLDARDDSAANKKHALGWCFVFKK